MVSRLIIVALLTSALSSCGLTSLIPTGGTNVAANTQVGAENNQGVNTSIDRSVRPVATIVNMLYVLKYSPKK